MRSTAQSAPQSGGSEDIVSGDPLSGTDAVYARWIQEGIEEVQLTGRLRGKPAIIVHGRSDTLVPSIMHRARTTNEQLSEGQGHRNLSYVEVTNAPALRRVSALPRLRGAIRTAARLSDPCTQRHVRKPDRGHPLRRVRSSDCARGAGAPPIGRRMCRTSRATQPWAIASSSGGYAFHSRVAVPIAGRFDRPRTVSECWIERILIFREAA